MVLTTRLLDATQFDATRARIAGYAVVGVAALYGMGVLVAGDGSFTRCIGWPLGFYYRRRSRGHRCKSCG